MYVFIYLCVMYVFIYVCYVCVFVCVICVFIYVCVMYVFIIYDSASNYIQFLGFEHFRFKLRLVNSFFKKSSHSCGFYKNGKVDCRSGKT